MNKQTISNLQLAYFVISVSIGTFPYMISEIIEVAGRTSYVAAFISGLLIIPIGLFILYFSKLFPGKTLLEVVEITSGIWMARILGLLYVVVSLGIAVLALRMFIATLKNFFLPGTPLMVIDLIVVLISVLIVSKGVENVGRMLEIMSPLLHLNFLLAISLGLFKEFSLHNVYPVFVEAPSSFFNGVFLTTGSISEILLFMLVLVAFLPAHYKSSKPLIHSKVTLAFLVSGGVFLVLGIYGAETAKTLSFAGMNVAYGIKVGKFIQGLEGFVLLSFEFLVFITVSAHLLSGTTVVKQLLPRTNVNVILGVLAIVVLIVIKYITFNEAIFYTTIFSRFVALPFVIVFLVVVWIGTLVYKRKKRESTLAT